MAEIDGATWDATDVVSEGLKVIREEIRRFAEKQRAGRGLNSFDRQDLVMLFEASRKASRDMMQPWHPYKPSWVPRVMKEWRAEAEAQAAMLSTLPAGN